MFAPALRRALPRDWVPQIAELHGRMTTGARVADVGCGEGWSSIGLAETYPGITVHGHDVDEHAIEAARRHAAEAGVADRVAFSVCLPDSLSHPDSVATGTVMRPSTLDGYAKAAGFTAARPLDLAGTGFWRFYQLTL